ncbi:MAG: ABC transporter substrate-binding protein [Candidatus Thiodiazotropha sp. (ex Lucinoma annulata)]|nr:ABC transporter substrate-binding protein [Candidatus Thiodiazotropha sp. (ex Lucinoma borealis)]MCU7855300.1 ABC transporter substrate-binding protein [Candidatus Thiodiazotropha sp. (ex Lucinoma borealis)]MCU7864302.1 ABC transporter substrate-binding protein [Candidatus Thiodiazotropha sp. (ex Lucinoma borealis)]MCU7868533.1 ABC transporter substrate-binding protein [Candidatus Thiodiazotropha sp. (ex Lucinoma borealis)]MCU7885359.1 ABC transporter substrate-binding protein [Candidatus Th
MAGTVSGGTLDFGKVGEPVDLVIGYQPYYTEAWSGVIMRDQKLYEKYLPKGSTVEFSIGLQGSVIVNAMLAGKQHIGYMGDMPAIVSTTKQKVADIRIVATAGLGTDQCNIFLSKMDAPKFSSAKEAIKWLDGKQVAVPKGACTDRFALAVFEKEGVKPASYLNQNIEVITSGFRAGKLDAAAIWEPTASRLVAEGLAKRIASGASIDENDGGFIAMRGDLILQRPDIVKAWLNAELDAQLFMANPDNADAIVKMAASQTTGFQDKVLWSSLYEGYAVEQGGAPVRVELAYGITQKAQDLINKATKFLHTIKSINVDTLRQEAVMTEFTEAILKERGLTAPIGEIKSLPASAYTGVAFKHK